MQHIEHKYINHSVLFDYIEKMYYLMSENYRDRYTEDVLPRIFKPLADTFFMYSYMKSPKYKDETFIPLSPLEDKHTCIVCTSGGKDSIAATLKLKQLGFNIILYHMHGINQAYYDEYTAVKTIADKLELPYYIEDVKLIGSHQYVEHPMKNMLIANGAINYCLKNDLPVNIVFGNYLNSNLNDMEFDICAGDSIDMWRIYDKIIQNIIPNYKTHIILEDISKTYEILEDNIDVLGDCISCISPYRFREYWKHRTEQKYGIELLPHRCGCCHKCCLEYIVLADADKLPYNDEYYHHCFDILKKTSDKETGIGLTDQSIWNRYFWYEMDKSHM